MMYFLALAVMLAVQPASEPVGQLRLPRAGGVYVVAHRGVHEGIPENTLAAYRKAIELGADFIEIDLRQTRDGHLVSVHNHTVDDYTADATGPVNEFTLEELRALDIGSRVGPAWAKERIPTFEEILELCRGRIGIYLDLKQGDVEKMAALVRKHGMAHDVIWYGGMPHLRELRALCPECIPMPDPGPEQGLERTLSLFNPKVVASVWKNLSEAFVNSCHHAGAKVIVDDDGPETWAKMLDWGVDGIQTDHVADLIVFLKGHGPGDALKQPGTQGNNNQP